MGLTVQASDLKPIFAQMRKLGQVRFEGKGKRLIITASDGDVAYTRIVPAVVRGELVKTTILAKALPAVSQLRGDITLKRIPAGFEMYTPMWRRTFAPQDIGVPKPRRMPKGVIVDAAELAAALSKTVFATSTAALRYAMHGIRLTVRGRTRKMLELAATDGRRLAVARIKCEGDVNAVFLSKAARIAVRLLRDSEGRAEIRRKGEEVQIKASKGSIITGSLDGVKHGKFPDYRSVIPKLKDTLIRAEVERLGFIAAMEMAIPMRDDDLESARLCFGPNGLLIEAGSGATGDVKVGGTIVGELKLLLNPVYILDALEVLSGDTVKMRMSDAESVVCIEEQNYGYYVMPIAPADGEVVSVEGGLR